MTVDMPLMIPKLAIAFVMIINSIVAADVIKLSAAHNLCSMLLCWNGSHSNCKELMMHKSVVLKYKYQQQHHESTGSIVDASEQQHLLCTQLMRFSACFGCSSFCRPIECLVFVLNLRQGKLLTSRQAATLQYSSALKHKR